jgi:preprotein translocase subunit YajC
MGTSIAFAAANAASATGSTPNPLMSFLPLVVVCGILYMLVIRPQQKQAKEHRRMVDNLKAGDRVLTQGGIYGTVINLKGTLVQVKIAENVKIDLSRSAISEVVIEQSNGTDMPTTGKVIS